jgi:hypothetical protein
MPPIIPGRRDDLGEILMDVRLGDAASAQEIFVGLDQAPLPHLSTSLAISSSFGI